MAPCPSFQALAEHVSGTSVDDAVERHLASCGKCRTQAGQVRTDNEFLASVLEGSDPGIDRTSEYPGYRVLDEIHRGGQGIVYRAVQLHTHRTVALKVLAEGTFGSELRRRRFEREVELVSRLRHPNIVSIHDSGTSASGRHYLVMEYVPGLHPQQYLEQQGEGPVDPRAVLELVARMCDGVQHAHLHGVIHRDLKPDNILVDAEGNPRILDFGMARGAGLDLTEDGSPLTVAGEFVGTLAYASPEQLKGDPELVESRTDVYSLGVILYGLLTGNSPYGVTSSVADLVHAICEVDPPPPGEVLSNLFQGRPGRFLKSPADLDAVVLKALAKERARRYQSVGELAEDLRCCLRGEPVAARHDSAWYLVRRSLARHRLAVGTLVAFIAVLALSAVLSFGFWKQAEDALVAAGKDRAAARLAASEAEELNAFFEDLFRSLNPVDTPGRAFLAQEVLDRAAEDLGRRFAEHPEAEKSLRLTLGHAYQSLGMPDPAARQFRRVLMLQESGTDPAPPLERAEVLYQLGETLDHLGGLEQAEDCVRRSRALVESADQPEQGLLAHLTGLEARLASRRHDDARATRLFEIAEQRSRALFGRSLALADVRTAQGRHHLEMGRLEPALDALQDAQGILAELGREESVLQAHISHHLARCLQHLGRVEEALEAAEIGDRLSARLLGPEHDQSRALAAFRAVLRHQQGLPGDDRWKALQVAFLANVEECRSEDDAYALASVASLLQAEGRLQDAERLMSRSAVLYEQNLGPDSLELAVVLGNLGTLYFELQDWDKAERHLRRSVAQVERCTPHLSRQTQGFRCTLAWMLAYRGEAAEARRLAQQVVDEARSSGLLQYEGIGLSVLGFAMCQGGEAAESVPVLREGREILEREMGEFHRESIHCRHHLAYSLAAMGEMDEAGTLYRDVAEDYQMLPPPGPAKAPTALNGYGQALFRAGLVEEACEVFEEALELYRQVGARSVELRVYLLNNRGAALLGLNRDDEAEEPLREAVSTARVGLPVLHQARLHSLMNLSRALEALGRPHEAADLWVEVREQARTDEGRQAGLLEQAAGEIRRLRDLGT